MPNHILLWESGAAGATRSITLRSHNGFLPSDGATSEEPIFSATEVHIVGPHGHAELHLSPPLEIPVRLLKQKDEAKNQWRCLSPKEIADAGAAEVVRALQALKEKYRAKLEQPRKVTVDQAQGQTFFGVSAHGQASLQASLQLSGSLLDFSTTSIPQGTRLLQASATASLQLSGTWSHGNDQHLAVASGQLRLEVAVLSQDQPIDAFVSFDVPDFPGFDLKLPRFRFDALNFDGINIPFQNLLPSITALNALPFGNALTFKWETAPTLSLKVANGALALATDPPPAKGHLSHNGTTVLTISDLTLQGTDTVQLNATITIPQNNLHFQVPRFEEGPFSVAPGDVTVQLTPLPLANGKPLSLDIGLEFERIVIASRNDPSLVLAFKLHLAVKLDGQSVQTEVTALEILEPSAIELLQYLAEAAQNLKGPDLRFALALPRFPVPGIDFAPVLKRIGDMLAAAARWLAERIADTGRLLAGIAEAIAQCLKDLYDVFSGIQAPGLGDHVAIEIRLDPRSWRLRQIVIMSAIQQAAGNDKLDASAFGLTLSCSKNFRPALVIDLVEEWFGLVIKHDAAGSLSLSTDLWLDKLTGPAEPLKILDPATGDQPPADAPKLLRLDVKTLPGAGELVLVALQRNQVKLFQTYGTTAGTEQIAMQDGNFAVALASSTPLVDADIGTVFTVTPHADDLTGKLLGLLPKPKAGEAGGGFIDQLAQYVEITDTKGALSIEGQALKYELGVKVVIERGKFEPQAQLKIEVDLRSLSMSLKGGDRIAITKPKGTDLISELLGFKFKVEQKENLDQQAKTYEALVLNLEGGRESLGLGHDARAEITYGQVTTRGRGLVFAVDEFQLGRDGLDLAARITPEPVLLGGVDMPFKFESGSAVIRKSRFVGGSLTGSGQLPRDLVGEANAHIALSLSERDGNRVVIDSAEAKLDKSADPIVCESTRFKLTITELGFGFVYEGTYHFYFQLTGSAVFNPASGDGDKVSGLLKHLGKIELKLNKTPLTSDPRVLMRSISFQVKCDPPLTTTLFDAFYLEARSFGFLPRCDKFDGAPAISVGGQAKLGFGDVVRTSITCHELLITTPKSPSAFPQVRFDGLAVGLQFGGMVKAEATAIAVDEKLPDLFKPKALPANVTANGFLAAGQIEISGWASMSAAMGFLELRKDKGSPRPAFFFYAQKNKLSQEIPTPVGNLYLREVGFGLGYRYTLAGIAQAETASSPRELVKILDEVSKYQGSLDQIQSWQPTYDSDTLTLAMRALFTVATASTSEQYRADAEKELSNPLLFDVVAAIRSDLTFLMNVRSWISVNYADWVDGGMNAEFKSQPSQRGYLYISVPRQEFLGRFIADRNGHVGKHPELPDALKKAIQSTDYSATLYIRPGLFHFELGWPHELGMDFGDPNGDFHLSLRGGLVHRIEDLALLTGIAFRGNGHVQFKGRVGNDSLGASALARADFAIEAKFISYLSLRSPGESMFYGSMQLDITVRVQVEVWLRFKVFGGTISMGAGFSLSLSLSVGLELVILLGSGIGGRAQVAIGVQAFGRSLSVGIGLSFNDELLALARARVARYMELGLGTDVPSAETVARREEPSPSLGPARSERAAIGDARIQEENGGVQPPPPLQAADNTASLPEEKRLAGRVIQASRFWALIFPTVNPDAPEEPYYVLQFVPRDHTALPPEETDTASATSTFYASPRTIQLSEQNDQPLEYTWQKDEAFDHRLNFASANEVPQDLFELRANGEILPVSEQLPENGREHTTHMSLDAPITPGSQPLTLGDFLLELFMAPSGAIEKGEDLKLTEPTPQHNSGVRADLGKHRDAAAERLARAGRSRAALRGQPQQEAEIEERRSAALAAIVASASALAETPQSWREAPTGSLDARHLGLTYLVSAKSLQTLFEGLEDGEDSPTPPGTKVTISKRDHDTPCEIKLFNPPSRHFRRAAPRLADLSHQRDAAGIRLDWGLEPAWGSSRGVYDDPEFHLKHYRIVRRIAGLKDGDWSQDFNVKASAPIERSGPHRVFLRAGMQFIDDFSLPKSLPAELRDFLCRRSTDPLAAWNKYTLGTDQAITVEYTVIPVDIAGTADVGTVREIAIERPFKQLISPREARLGIVYPSLQALGCSPEGDTNSIGAILEGTTQAALSFTMWPAIDPREANQEGHPKPVKPERGHKLRLRLRSDRVVAGGQFGANAVTSALRRPDEAEMDRLRSGDVDFQLEVDNEGPNLLPLVLEGKTVDDVGTSKLALKVSRVLDDGTLANHMDGLPDLRQALGLDASQPLSSIRLFVRRDDFDKTNNTVPGAWRMLTVGLAIRGLEPTEPDDEKGSPPTPVVAHPSRPRPVDAVLEAFEAPCHVEFATLSREDMAAESGQLHVVKVAADADLLKLHDSNERLPVARDLKRRVATRLMWHGQPRSLALANGDEAPALHRLIGGYELFSLDPDHLPDDPIKQAERLATKIARVTLLPASMRGLTPAEFGDLSRIETSYPSDAKREERAQVQAARSKVGKDLASRQAPWFSPAESTAILPEPLLRRSLICAPDDGMVDALFACGGPDYIVVVLENWPAELPSAEIHHELAHPLEGSGDFEVGKSLIKRVAETQAKAIKATFKREDGNPFLVSQARQLLQALHLGLGEAVGWPDALLATPDLCGKVALRVEAWRKSTGDKPDMKVANENVAFDPVGSLYPVLADTLDLITYAPLNEGLNFSQAEGQIFRRYTLVRDAGPQTSAQNFEAYVDEVPAQRDPYGWAMLRTLGLAAGFRLYDTELAEYVRGKDLLKKLHEAFSRARSRYPNCDLGHPFADLVTRPWGTAKLFWFDGGQRKLTPTETAQLLEDDLLATVQMSLRPAPDRLRHQYPEKIGHEMPVQYFVLNGKPKSTVFHVEFNGNESSPRYDIVEVGSEFTQAHPVRMGTGEGNTQSLKIDIPGDDSEQARIFVRVILPAGEDGSTPFSFPGLTFKAPSVPSTDLKPVDGPAAIYGGGKHEAYGLFKDLDSKDWAFALFRTKDTPHVLAFERLSYHAGRRFGRLAIPKPADASLREELAGRIIGAWKSFLSHGASERDAPHRLPYSLGTVADPGEWQLPVDADGRMSVLHVESDRFGSRRRYTVRPYGRFDALAKATPTKLVGTKVWKMPLATDLKGALPHDPGLWNDCWADATLPRTEPVAKPVILSATRLGDERVLELVVAHTPDQTMASANRATQAGLAQHGISIGFWREFAHPAWAHQLLTMTGTPTDLTRATFGSLDGEVVTEADEVKLTLTAPGLEKLRARVPDAWLGAHVIRARCMPYFFRVHALVHASAGVMVSEQAGTTFEEGFYELHFPWDDEHYHGKDITTPPRYSVSRDEVKRDVLLRFHIPTLRFIDCMSTADAELWFGTGGSKMAGFKPVAHLPDPGVGYRIVRELARPTGEAVSWEPEIDLLPQAQPADGGGLYVVQSLGTRLSPTAVPLPHTPLRTTSPLPPDVQVPGISWHLRLDTRLGPPPDVAPPAPPTPSAPWDDDWRDDLHSFRLDPSTPEDNTVWVPLAPRRRLQLELSKPPLDAEGKRDWSTLKQHAEQQHAELRNDWNALDFGPVQQALKLLQNIIQIASGGDTADGIWKDLLGTDQESTDIEILDWIAGLPTEWGTAIGKLTPLAWTSSVQPIRGKASQRLSVMRALKGAPESLQMAFHQAMRQAEIAHDWHELEQPYRHCPPLTKALGVVNDAELIQSVRDFDKEAIVTLLSPPETVQLIDMSSPSERRKLGDQVARHLEGRAGCSAALQLLSDWIDKGQDRSVSMVLPEHIVSNAGFRKDLARIARPFNPAATTTLVLVLWKPPTNDELRAWIEAATSARDRIASTVAEQLFGANRRATLIVSKGSAFPETVVFERQP